MSFFFMAEQLQLVQTPLPSLLTLHDHSQTHHTRWDSSGRVISPKLDLYLTNTKLSQEKDVHAIDGIRTHNPSKRTEAEPRL